MRHLSKNVLMKWIIVLLIVMPLLSTIPSTYTANASEPNSNQSVKVKKVIASYQQSYALDTKGHLWAWGYYDFFAFGGLKTPNRLTFFDNKVIKDIQGGPGFLQVLLDDGTVWVHYMYSPTNAKQFFGQVVGLNQIESIGEAVSIGYAKQKDGTVWKYAPTDLSQTPVKMPELSGAGFVTFYDEYGIKSDGTVWSLADSPTKPPTQITELANVKKIVPGDQSRPSYALTVNGEIWGWGKPVLYGYTNVVTTLRLLPDHALQTPVRMEGIEQVKDIAAGQAQFTALKADGTVWSWGLNKNSQLGDGTTTDSASPVKVKNLANVQSLYGGMQAQHAFAVLADGSLMAWGGNSQKETGTELTTKTVASPTKVKFPLQGDKAEDRFTFTFDGAKGNNLSAAVSDGKGKVIVQGENQFYQSTDYGQSWATKPFPLNLVDPQIRFEHNLYFLEGYSDLAKHLYTSKNGQDWTEIVLKEHRTLTIMDKLRITWQNNQYILSLYLNDEKKTALYTSKDGAAWNMQVEYRAELGEIVWNGKRYTAVNGGYMYYGAAKSRNQLFVYPEDNRYAELIVYTSPDIKSWTQQSGKANSKLNYTFSVNGQPRLNYGIMFSELQKDGTLLYHDDYHNEIISKDGMTFQLKNQKVPQVIKNLEYRSETFYNGKQYLIFGNLWRDEGVLLTSTDKVNWKQQKIANIPLQMSVTNTGKGFVGTDKTGLLAYSRDGLKWEIKRQAKPHGFINQVIKVNGKYVAVSSEFQAAVPAALNSNNGSTWAFKALSDRYSTMYDALNSVAWNGKVFAAVGLQYAWTSTNGTSWTRNQQSIDAYMYKVVWSGKQFVAIGDHKMTGNSAIYTSANGLSWKKAYSWTGKLKDLAVHNGTVVAVGNDGKQAVALRSTDALNWSKQAFELGKEITDWKRKQRNAEDAYTFMNVQWVRDSFVIVSDHIYSSKDGTKWTILKGDYEALIEANTLSTGSSGVVWTGKDYRLLSNNRIGVSKDLKSWRFYEQTQFYNWSSMIWTGTDMLVVGEGGTIIHVRDK